MSTREPLVRHISDTALLVANHRGRETERPDAVFRDPFARAPRRRAGRPDREINALQQARNVGLDHTLMRTTNSSSNRSATASIWSSTWLPVSMRVRIE